MSTIKAPVRFPGRLCQGGQAASHPAERPPIRAAAAGAGGARTPQKAASKVSAATVDPDRLAAIVGTDVAEGSVALLVDGRAGAPWTPVTAADLTAGLVPAA